MPFCFSLKNCLHYHSFPCHWNVLPLLSCRPLSHIIWKLSSFICHHSYVAQMVKNLTTMWETRVCSLSWEDSLEKGRTTRSSILACGSSWTEEPDGLQSVGLQRLGHDQVTNTYTCVFSS